MNANLFIVAVAVIYASIGLGWRTAPWQWRIWALFYGITELALYEALRSRLSHVYPPLWYAQQFGTALLLIPVVRKTINPAINLVVVSGIIALIFSGIIAQAHHWPTSHMETVMEVCGTVTLMLGFIAAIGSIAVKTFDAYILAGFLLLYSALMLGGSDYLQSTGIGCAWSVLEIASFGAWAVYYRSCKGKRL